MKSSAVKNKTKPVLKTVHEYIVDTTASVFSYYDLAECEKDAKKAYKKYQTKDMPHFKDTSYSDAILQGIVWFSSKKVK